MRKKISASITILFLLILTILTGCNNLFIRNENEKFRSYTHTLFCEEVAANTITLHYTLQHPEHYGIKQMPITFGSFTPDTAAASASIENCLAALENFKRSRLSEPNQLTYDVLEKYLDTALYGVRYTLYEEPLSPMTGIQAQLPVLLSEFQLRSKSDIDDYLLLLEQVPAYFDSLIQFETAKSEAGLFMAAYTAESIQKECNSFLLMGSQNYLYSSFLSRLDQIEPLSDEEKNNYISQNETLIQNSVFPAYEKLKTTLATLQGSGKNNNGLCYYPDGASYYEYIVKQQTGSSRTISELQELTRRQMLEDLTAIQSILTETGDQAETKLDTSTFTLENSDPTFILNDLKSKLNDSFPKPPEVSTEIKYVQKEMEEYLSPAFYMIPAIDNTSENVIYINEAHLPDDLDLFTTIAHEGYPGHLYQTIYYASQNPDPIRNILSFGGYTEGWATYTEMLSYYYAPLTKEQAVLMQRNTSVILSLYALADMGIHYDGWTLLDTVSFFRQYGIQNTEMIETIYDLIIADPANYLKYYIGYIEFLELKKEAIDAWGKDFTQKKFHKAVLDIGPAPFDIVREYTLD